MTNPELSSPLLRRYWFKTRENTGIGVTGYTVDDARNLIDDASLAWDYEVLEVVEDVDIRDLDQGHVVPNIGPVNFRGVWYPNLTSLVKRS